MTQSGRLAGKRALVTGGSRGIGAAIVRRLAAEGAAVAVNYVADQPSADTLVGELRGDGHQVAAFRADVSDAAQTAELVERVVAEFGGLDIVCATAGITSRGLATELSEAAWQTMVDINLSGVWRTCKVTAPHLIARGSGSVILVSSIAGLRGLLGVAHYTAAKHGIVGLMRSLANELAPHGIRVNSVHPTNVDTPLIQNAAVASAFRPDLDREPTREEFAEAAQSMNMLDIPWVEPFDVANACLFLASDEARYVTSVALPVDAGATQR